MNYVLVFDYRSDDGPPLVGPFPSRETAFDYAGTLGGTLEYEAQPLASPEPVALTPVERQALIGAMNAAYTNARSPQHKADLTRAAHKLGLQRDALP